MKRNRYTVQSVQAKILWHTIFTISCFNILLQTNEYDKYIDVGWNQSTDMLLF